MKCLNCGEETEKDKECEKCAWINEEREIPSIRPVAEPIIMKMEKSEGITQIAYPPIDKKLLSALPEKLKTGVKQYFRDKENLTRKQRENIYHNLYDLNLERWERKLMRIEARIRFAKFFQKTNFLKREV